LSGEAAGVENIDFMMVVNSSAGQKNAMGQPVAHIGWRHSRKLCICRVSEARKNILWDSQCQKEALFERGMIKVCNTKIENRLCCNAKSSLYGLLKWPMGWY